VARAATGCTPPSSARRMYGMHATCSDVVTIAAMYLKDAQLLLKDAQMAVMIQEAEMGLFAVRRKQYKAVDTFGIIAPRSPA